MTDPATPLRTRIRAPRPDPTAIGAYLDGLGEPERIAAVRGLGRADQRRLYRLVEGHRPVTLLDVVPETTGPLRAVRHYGRNTLGVLTLFEKRFYRGDDGDPLVAEQLYGINVHPSRPLVGPGYFVAVEDPTRGEVLIDYRRLPTRAPEGWVKITPNDRGLARFAYGFMVDTLRGVSEHVTIGSAARGGRDLGAYFVLCRQELP